MSELDRLAMQIDSIQFLEEMGCTAHITDSGIKITIPSNSTPFSFNQQDFGQFIIERFSMSGNVLHMTLKPLREIPVSAPKEAEHE